MPYDKDKNLNSGSKFVSGHNLTHMNMTHYTCKSPGKNIKKPINPPKNNVNIKETKHHLEVFYNNLGHHYYTQILKIFEMYCYFGKINTNFEMDFSQFTTFMQQNSMYDKTLDKTYSELTFNKIKGLNKCKKIFIL
jgi:hypothetical protein